MHNNNFNNLLSESLGFKDLEGLMKPTVHVDEFSSKMGDDDDVVARHERARRRKPQAVDIFVDRSVLFDKGVRVRDIGLRLIVIVVADKIFDGVVRKKILELRIELRSERFIVRNN